MDIDTIAADWSAFRDHAAQYATAREAIDASPHREAFAAVLGKFAAKANRHELIKVYWWHAPYIYVEVHDRRREYPISTRALVSFDLTNGEFDSYDSVRRYSFARRGWRSFLADILRVHPDHVSLYSDEPMAVTLAERYGTP